VVGTFFGSSQDVHNLLELAIANDINAQIERYRLEDVHNVHARLRENNWIPRSGVPQIIPDSGPKKVRCGWRKTDAGEARENIHPSAITKP